MNFEAIPVIQPTQIPQFELPEVTSQNMLFITIACDLNCHFSTSFESGTALVYQSGAEMVLQTNPNNFSLKCNDKNYSQLTKIAQKFFGFFLPSFIYADDTRRLVIDSWFTQLLTELKQENIPIPNLFVVNFDSTELIIEQFIKKWFVIPHDFEVTQHFYQIKNLISSPQEKKHKFLKQLQDIFKVKYAQAVQQIQPLPDSNQPPFLLVLSRALILSMFTTKNSPDQYNPANYQKQYSFGTLYETHLDVVAKTKTGIILDQMKFYNNFFELKERVKIAKEQIQHWRSMDKIAEGLAERHGITFVNIYDYETFNQYSNFMDLEQILNEQGKVCMRLSVRLGVNLVLRCMRATQFACGRCYEQVQNIMNKMYNVILGLDFFNWMGPKNRQGQHIANQQLQGEIEYFYNCFWFILKYGQESDGKVDEVMQAIQAVAWVADQEVLKKMGGVVVW